MERPPSRLLRGRTLFACIAVCGSLAVIGPVLANAEPYPLEYWALRAVMTNVEVSPDGIYLGLMKIPNREGNAIIEVYEAADLTKEPFRVNAEPMEIRSFDWVSDTNMVVSLREQVRDRIEGYNEGVYETRIASLDVEERDFHTFDERGVTVEHLLPKEPDKIIISFNEGGDDSSKLAEPFRPRSYHKFDLKRQSKSLLIRGRILLGNIDFDGDGHPWLARGFDIAKRDRLWYIRKPGESGWDEVYRLSEDNFDGFAIAGFDDNDRNTLIVGAQNGDDKIGAWEYYVDTKSFGALIYRRSDVDLDNVSYHSNYWTNPDTVTGVVYYTDKRHIEYFDELEAATYQQLEGLIPNAYNVTITSRSRDGKTLTFFNSGPRDPGTYYLVKDGRLKVIGSRQPLFKAEDLADVKYIKYKARDGKTIPGYLTMPKGEPPFPTIILPHGGPYVSEAIAYDEWGQLLANRGYLVLQPQYRGSQGHGLEHWMSAFSGTSQAGRKMQDDKDDGALYLVEEGLADPERLAMFGWSYGGYAALIAASRTPQLYQCVIGGAAVSDPTMQVNYARDTLRGASVESWLDLWLNGVSPVEEAAKVNVPILLIHGDVDQRVPLDNAKVYRRALDKHKKDYKYVELEGADHFSSTLFYDHKLELYQSLIDYLKDDCGPGGL